MNDRTRPQGAGAPLGPVQAEVKNLITMFDYFLAQRELEKPVESLGEIVRDMRIIIGRLLMDHFMSLSDADGEKFTGALAEMLADCCESQKARGDPDDEYSAYCVGEILTTFEYAREIKKEFADDMVLQKMLALDIPILRPFDYGLRGRFKVLESKKKRILHK
jgi:hypothetical protein